MRNLNLTMLMDFYELTMANGFFEHHKSEQKAVFDVFFRMNSDDASYAIFAGLDQIIDYLLDLKFNDDDIKYLESLNCFSKEFLNYLKNFKFHADIYAFKEGSIIYPNEPIITVCGSLIECQLLETMLLLVFNHSSLIATKAKRITLAAKDRIVSDFGARRAHNYAAAIYGARAAYIGGVGSTSNVLASKLFNIPCSGTMAHSWVMAFDSEYEAFLAYSKTYPDNAVLLIDTYDVLKSGLVNAIKVNNDYLVKHGSYLKGVRIDSGDLAYLSKEVRRILDENHLEKTKIFVSNALDEFKINSLLQQGAKIDAFGVGENLMTGKPNPVFGGVYKLVAIEENNEFVPRIKLSNTVEKITNPGFKEVYRVFKNGKAIADLLTLKGEEVDLTKPYHIYDSNKLYKENLYLEGCELKKMHVEIFKNGELVYKRPSLDEIRDYVNYQINNELWEEETRLYYPHLHYLDFSPKLKDVKVRLMKNE